MKELSKTSTTIKTTDDGSHCSNECPFFCFNHNGSSSNGGTSFCRLLQQWTEDMERHSGCIETFGMPEDVTNGQNEPAGKTP